MSKQKGKRRDKKEDGEGNKKYVKIENEVDDDTLDSVIY